MACYLGLGSNLGDRLAWLRAALTALADVPAIRIDRCSSLYETAPVGGPKGQGPYLNAVAEIRGAGSPDELLVLTQEIECTLGRQRTVRNGPRIIDLDLLLFGDLIRTESDLTLPHPRLHQRRFVLEPLAEIAPEIVIPTLGRTARDLLTALPAGAGAQQECVRLGGPNWFADAGIPETTR